MKGRRITDSFSLILVGGLAMISSLSSATRLAVSSTTTPTSRRSSFLACFALHSFHNRKIPFRHFMMSSLGGTDDSPQNNNKKPPPIPRAAVSVCVRCTVSTNKNPYYLLIQRGKEPNKGMWSLPGGSIEFGEDAVDAGMRELAEETVWEASVKGANSNNCKQKDQDVFSELQWYRGTVTTTDAIGQGYHYLIAHCFAELIILVQEKPSTASSEPTTVADCCLPRIQPADDADDASWLTARQIRDLEQSSNPNRHITPGVVRVIQRVEELSAANLLPTSKQI